ncbi:PilZ domain-containing protein [Kaarinaea lacus]
MMRLDLGMEKRWSERKELSVGVDIYQQGELLDSCFSRDIGLGGTFLGTATSLPMQRDSDVELVFHLDTEEQISRHKIHARVTRVSEDGVGFKFRDFDTGVFRSLQEIMSYKTKDSTSH